MLNFPRDMLHFQARLDKVNSSSVKKQAKLDCETKTQNKKKVNQDIEKLSTADFDTIRLQRQIGTHMQSGKIVQLYPAAIMLNFPRDMLHFQARLLP